MATSTTTSTPDAKSTDFNKLAQNLSKIVEQSQRVLQEYLKRQEHGDPLPFVDPVLIGKSFQDLFQHLLKDPDQLIQAQTEFWKRSLDLWQAASKRMLGQESPPVIQASPGDKRFKDAPWTENVVFDFIKQSYLLAADSLQGLVNQVEGLDDKTARKVQFYTRQFVDAMAPTNFVLTNPTVLQATLDSGGDNLVKGLQNMLADLERGRGQLQIKMTDLKAFTPGENIAVTPGKVVFQNDLLQLIQYAPSTPTVHQRPFLFVSPWINKFYIMDMRPKNSMVKWMVDQGFTVFMTSWVNPDERLANKQFEDYMLSIVAALDAIEQATGEREVNTAGYCLGGTLLLSTLAYLAAQGDQRVQSAICFACMTDFSAPGELEVFIDEELITLLEKQMGERGYLDGSQMAGVFSMLRANDLIWYFVVNNYLLGNKPPAFDILAWNSDTTRLPAKYHADLLGLIEKNPYRKPGTMEIAGRKIDMRQVNVGAYVIGGVTDHITPWKGCYGTARMFGEKSMFVLANAGHLQSLLNPPGAPKAHFFAAPAKADSPEDWAKSAIRTEGSWWPHWREWIRARSGELIKAPRKVGSRKYRPLCAAPGTYVFE